jgi:hypothetical protein
LKTEQGRQRHASGRRVNKESCDGHFEELIEVYGKKELTENKIGQ